MPRSTPCPSCGQMFLPSGLRFHVKTCVKKQAEVIVSCGYCNMEMPQRALDGHIAVCKAARRALGGSNGGAAPGRRKGSGPGWAPGEPDALAAFGEESLADGRGKCQFCGRAFTNARIHDHRRICSNLRQARPASIGGVRTQLPSRIYNSAAARTTGNGSFDRCRQRLFIPRTMAESQGVLVRCAGVARRIGSRPAATLSPWTVLGVRRNAGLNEVKSAYKRLAMEWHPDRHPASQKAEAEARFKSIAEAYESITKRRRKAPRRQLALVAPEAWRGKHQEVQSLLRNARGARPAMPSPLRPGGAEPKDGRIPCPHCGRRFGGSQAERHIPACVGIVNKPKPPPRALGSSGPCSPAAKTARGAIDFEDFAKTTSSFPTRNWGNGMSKNVTEPRAKGPPMDRDNGPAKPRGVAFVPGQPVKLLGLKGAPELNGSVGVLRGFDESSKRWHVQLGDSKGSDGPTIGIRLENMQSMVGAAGERGRTGVATQAIPSAAGHPPVSLALAAGAAVRLSGLSGAAHLNGTSGILRSFDQAAARWHVEFSDGEVKSVKADNLHVATLGYGSSACGGSASRGSSGCSLP